MDPGTDTDVDSGADLDTAVGNTDTGTPLDSADTSTPLDTGELPEPLPQSMVKAFFGPMLLDVDAHAFDDPAAIEAMGFDTVDLSQYVLLGPDGVVSSMFSETELRSRVEAFSDVGLQVSLTFVPGYSRTGDEAGAVWNTQYTDEGADIEEVLGHLTDHMVGLVPLMEEMGIYQLSVYEPDLLFYEKTNTDGSPNFDAVSRWSQTHRLEMAAAGWGDTPGEQLIWKFGYYYVPPTASGSNVPIDIDFSGYDGAGFSISAEDPSWESEPSIWASIYRNQVDRFLEHFAESLPDDTVWPAITEFGAADAICGFWLGESAQCSVDWTEAHIEAAFHEVTNAVHEWNISNEVQYRGVYALDSPSDSDLFGFHDSALVRETLAEGLAELE